MKRVNLDEIKEIYKQCGLDSSKDNHKVIEVRNFNNKFNNNFKRMQLGYINSMNTLKTNE